MWREELKVGNKNVHEGEFLMTFYRYFGLDLTGARIYCLGSTFVWVMETTATDTVTLPLAAQTQLPLKQAVLKDEHLHSSFGSPSGPCPATDHILYRALPAISKSKLSLETYLPAARLFSSLSITVSYLRH